MLLKVYGMNVISVEDNIGDNSRTFFFSKVLHPQCSLWSCGKTNKQNSSMSELKSGPTEPNSEHDQVLHIPAQAAPDTDSVRITGTNLGIPIFNFSRWPQCSSKIEKLWAETEAGAWA